MFITIILVLLGIALIAVFINRKKDEEKARIGILGITFAIIVLTIIRLVWGTGGDGGYTYDPSTDHAVAEIAASRIGHAAKGRRAVIIAESSGANLFNQTRLEVLQAELERQGLEILGVEEARPNAETEEGIFGSEETIEIDAVENALRNYSGVEVLISLAGIPGEGMERLDRRLARVEFYAMEDHPYVDWVSLMREGILNGLILSPTDADWSFTEGSKEEIFDHRYVFVTPENFNEVSHRINY